MEKQITFDEISKLKKEENISTARELVKNDKWVPLKITPPLSEGYYMITVKGYSHPFIARFYPNNEPGLKEDGGYWRDNIYTLNDYGVIAWKPAPDVYIEN